MPAGAQSYQAWAAKAQKAQQRGDNEVAVEYWTNALRVWQKKDGAPARAKALGERAMLYDQAGEMDGALADLNQAIKLDKRNAVFFDRRGQIFMEMDKLPDAISDFYSAITIKFNFADAYMHRGLAYEKQGEAKFAKEDFANACKLGIDDACIRAGKKPRHTAKAKKEAPPKEEEAAPADDESAKAATAEPDDDQPQVKAKPRKTLKGSPSLRSGEAGKASAKQAAAKADAAAPSTPAKPLGKTIGREPKKAAKSVDFDACVAAIEGCNSDGNAIDQCINRVKVCENEPVKGCCPQACVRQFNLHADPDASDAALFREIFQAKSPCAQPQ